MGYAKCLHAHQPILPQSIFSVCFLCYEHETMTPVKCINEIKRNNNTRNNYHSYVCFWVFCETRPTYLNDQIPPFVCYTMNIAAAAIKFLLEFTCVSICYEYICEN